MAYPDTNRLPLSDADTDQTLRAMADAARQAAPALALPVRPWLNVSPQARCLMIREFLARHTVYQSDPPGVELLRHPLEMLDAMNRAGRVGPRQLAPGDCEDVATLGAALALACGLRARWQLVKFGTRDAPWAHVYAEVAPAEGGQWVELDVHRPKALPGLIPGQTMFSQPVEL